MRIICVYFTQHYTHLLYLYTYSKAAKADCFSVYDERVDKFKYAMMVVSGRLHVRCVLNGGGNGVPSNTNYIMRVLYKEFFMRTHPLCISSFLPYTYTHMSLLYSHCELSTQRLGFMTRMQCEQSYVPFSDEIRM